ncbi:methyltransferase [Chelativorans sp. Marseille-P2723]|uniref:tRNA1(Val) (adenine(37)-N6)-methyltransferase n=1 Tax=Chelativorans sp. Marseille-P2723 TaxID=2709133 RepID=UPI001570EC4C|nr:methyltransferase [Chelativorans sp. Marseille-P2723]
MPHENGPSFTTDSFHRGRFHLVQPAGRGHRAGLDAMLLAATVPGGFDGRLADLGAGGGAAGFAVAARCPKAQVILVERSAEMVDCARRSIALKPNAAIAPRLRLLQADVELCGRARVEAGLADNAFDFVIMNPPFNAPEDRATPDALRRQAHVMEGNLFERWLRTASAIARPRAELAVIARPASLGEILQALSGRFGSPAVLPVHPRPGADAIRILLKATKGARGGLRLLHPLILHGSDGHAFTQEADDAINGRSALFSAAQGKTIAPARRRPT